MTSAVAGDLLGFVQEAPRVWPCDQASDLAASCQNVCATWIGGYHTARSHRRISSSVQSAGSFSGLVLFGGIQVQALASFWIRFGRKYLIAPNRPCRRCGDHACKTWWLLVDEIRPHWVEEACLERGSKRSVISICYSDETLDTIPTLECIARSSGVGIFKSFQIVICCMLKE
ncbi:hypothetical protein ASPVEDRAFT_671061 [Aspergillus versicolor CBS 583.65]|uniref:Uncharacterized protein n=1 Tax=Aspergillus versicolor CBS 583.65 TaxID=1036611 RepID=A0A1L9PLE9_ASPVE|nr:uncharacterized protein ASPVEDRAFT_671061 [Aspergillus versicolor CBS 583.65]OJJ02357.1 hypothetical protein ASPVEDRAFT_671061 [Aspergillus versicolor CBS 583.65]